MMIFSTVFLMYVQIILGSVKVAIKVVTFWERAAHSVNHMFCVYLVYLLSQLLPILYSVLVVPSSCSFFTFEYERRIPDRETRVRSSAGSVCLFP